MSSSMTCPCCGEPVRGVGVRIARELWHCRCARKLASVRLHSSDEKMGPGEVHIRESESGGHVSYECVKRVRYAWVVLETFDRLRDAVAWKYLESLTAGRCERAVGSGELEFRLCEVSDDR